MDHSSSPPSAPLRTAAGTPLQSIYPIGVESTPAAIGETLVANEKLSIMCWKQIFWSGNSRYNYFRSCWLQISVASWLKRMKEAITLEWNQIMAANRRTRSQVAVFGGVYSTSRMLVLSCRKVSNFWKRSVLNSSPNSAVRVYQSFEKSRNKNL